VKNFKVFKFLVIFITFFLIVFIFQIPCIFHPFDWKHDTYDWGFKYGYGRFPTQKEKMEMMEYLATHSKNQ